MTLVPRIRLIGLYWRTLRHLKAIQIVNRIQRRLFVPTLPERRCTTQTRAFRQTGFIPQKEASYTNPNRFRFLNETANVDFPDGWDDPSFSLLWRYNLHYFDCLAHKGTAEADKLALIHRWISDNSHGKGTGWEPYPLSLRIVNWIKWGWQQGKLTDSVDSSLYQQAVFLEKTLEYHLLGNHLLENAKALIFAGLYFSGKTADSWLAKGAQILNDELQEQILGDGAHFELSPMYHSIMLELVTDVLRLAKNPDSPIILKSQAAFLETTAWRMANWLQKVIHPDGEISFFNDGSIGIAKDPQTLIDTVEALTGRNTEIDNSKVKTGDSGLVRLSHGGAVVLFDAGEVGPSYLPGHAHADTLSLELSLFDQRLFVNVGTSEYGHSQRRSYERSTEAHSTLTLSGMNSSEVWAGFRVGRRARVRQLEVYQEEQAVTVSAKHDGYRFLSGKPLHSRSISLGPSNRLEVSDSVSRECASAIVRYHLHPMVSATIDKSGCSGEFRLPSGQVLNWYSSAVNTSIESFQYAPSFGVLVDTKTLLLVCNKQGVTSLTIEW